MKIFTYLILFLSFTFSAKAQNLDSLMATIGSETSVNIPVTATFKTTRVILSHSNETVKKYNMDFRVAHRFGDFAGKNGGIETLYGLDNASDIRIAFEYGISDKLTFGFGRNKIEQLLDFYLKYKLIQQTTNNSVPVSVTLFSTSGLNPRRVETDIYDNYAHRFSYVTQAIITRKFSPNLSLQISPTWLHRNYVNDFRDENDNFALGIAGRYKFTKRFAFVADYYFVQSNFRQNKTKDVYYNPLGLGIEIETGGHVFSINFTNAEGIVENNFIPDTKSSWLNGGFRFGFNISRMFTLYTPKG